MYRMCDLNARSSGYESDALVHYANTAFVAGEGCAPSVSKL